MDTKALPLKGYKSLGALNSFHKLLLGLKMIPEYFNLSYEDFHNQFEDKNEEEKEKFIRQAIVHVPLLEEEVEALVCFATDKNGVPYTRLNIKNLGPNEIMEIMVCVCMEIGKIKITLVSESEKKN